MKGRFFDYTTNIRRASGSVQAYSRTCAFLKDMRTMNHNHREGTDNSLCKRMCTNIEKKITQEIDGLEREMIKIINQTPSIKHEVEIMTSMPGIGLLSASVFLGELGSFKSFQTREQLSALSGLNPMRIQSGSSINRTRISKHGSAHVRRILYMDSKTSVRKIPALQELYNRILAKGGSRLSARCATMRKILLILRGMVISDTKFKDGVG